MRFLETPLAGAFVIDLELMEDERGFFARSFCRDEFEKHGLNPNVAQCSVSFNRRRGTLRGLHYQAKPHEEARLVRCTVGSIYDVIVDIRPESKSYLRWFSAELSASNRRMLYVPEGFAHGFQTLSDDVEVFYQMTETYRPDSSRGIRWNAAEIGIAWPIAELIISERDRALPLLNSAA